MPTEKIHGKIICSMLMDIANQQIHTVLPLVSVVEVLANRVHVNGRNQQQIQAQAQISKRQVAHQKLGHRHLFTVVV